jgi:photosystem II stability/assembly factor-like uncharacterized protein
LTLCLASLAIAGAAFGQAPIDPRLYSALTWRNLGPFRAGRVAAVSGVIGQPGVFYIGLPAGGVWKTTSAGETWYPIFDDVKDVASIGAVEVAPSDPKIVYVGTGDIIAGGGISEGNGVYKSIDAGRTWTHLGLDATKQIPSMSVDPKDPNIVLVAAQGDVRVKSSDRGIFRSTDGGATWTRALFVDDSTGAQKIARAFDVPTVLFATTILHHTPARPPSGPTGPTSTKLFKSTDGGVTWQEIVGNGLPRLTGKAWVAVAMNTNAQRVFVIGDWGLYRSDDGGATWRRMAADDQRIRSGQGGYNCGVYVNSKNPDIVYTVSTSSYISRDGGNTFTGFKGAPGGDDPQQLWLDPTDANRILAGYDQGAIVTLDGGATWSSWYNQSTDQIYHLSVDNSYPYWVYGTQQDAGAIRTRIRGNLGAITPLDWSPVPGWEWGTIVPDPLDNNTIFSSGSGVVKISYPSEQWINVSPAVDPSLKLRANADAPLRFAPWNKRMLVAGFQSVWSTTDGGMHWTQMSPDLGFLSGLPPGSPAALGTIQSMSLSTVAPGLIWVGTNNGLMKMTRDGGKAWIDVTIPSPTLPIGGEVFSFEASSFDAGTAYVVVDHHRNADYTPYIFRTRDFGKTWTKIVNGLPTNQPNGSFARVVREDPKRKGLLFAGTESGMYVSFDDGDHWQSLMLNLPATSYRDMVLKDNDIVVATYGRGFFALDDYSALRQMTPAVANEAAHLFKPGDAVRVRRNVGADTPFPPEVPHALNPPDGVILDYWLAQSPASDISIDVLDATGALVRHLSSAPAQPVSEAARPPHPNFWVAPPLALPKNAGGNRSNWDLRYDSPHALTHSFQINANPGLTPPSPEGPLALPGTYTIRLTANGRAQTQTVVVRPDPRSTASPAALRAQHDLQMKLMQGMEASFEGRRVAQLAREALAGDSLAATLALVARLDTVGGPDAGRGRGRGGQAGVPNFAAINAVFASQLEAQEQGDHAPTSAMLAAFTATCKDLTAVAARWKALIAADLSSINAALTKRGGQVLKAEASALNLPSCIGQ